MARNEAGGRPAWSARDPLIALGPDRIEPPWRAQDDRGIGRGPGGPAPTRMTGYGAE